MFSYMGYAYTSCVCIEGYPPQLLREDKTYKYITEVVILSRSCILRAFPGQRSMGCIIDLLRLHQVKPTPDKKTVKPYCRTYLISKQ